MEIEQLMRGPVLGIESDELQKYGITISHRKHIPCLNHSVMELTRIICVRMYVSELVAQCCYTRSLIVRLSSQQDQLHVG